MFKVSKYDSTYMSKDFTKAESQVSQELDNSHFNYKLKYKDVSHGYMPKKIIQDFWKEYEIDITYVKAWRTREVALSMIRGFPKDFYTLLAQYGEVLKICYPSTYNDLETEPNDHLSTCIWHLGHLLKVF